MAKSSRVRVEGPCLLGYPLHPQADPSRVRADDLFRIVCPMLFVQGTRDRGCDLDTLRQALTRVGAPTTLQVLQEADNQFKVLKKSGRTDEEKGRVRARLETVDSGVSGAHFRKSLDRWFTPAFQQAHPEVIERLAEQNRQNDPAAYAAAYRVLAEGDLAARLHEIEAPSLVMTGEGDIGSNPRMARLMAKRIPRAELKILPGLRHSILTEAPGVVAEALEMFLR